MEKKRKYLWLYFVAFIIPVFTMLAHMFLTNCYPFGENTIMIRDADAQYVPFLNYMVEKAKTGGSLQFDWHSGLGSDYYATFFYYLASPFNLLMFLFGSSHVELGALVIFLVQIGGCGVTALYFFRHTRYNRLTTGRDMMSLLFALAYAMCGYILAYQYNFIWLISLMLTPLVLLGIEYMVERRDYRLYFVSVLLTLLTNFYFAWYVCIFAIIYFIDQDHDGVKKFFRNFLRFLGVSVTATLCSAVVLVPCYLSVLNKGGDASSQNLSNINFAYFGDVADFLRGFFLGEKLDTMGESWFVNNNYCGIFMIVLVLCFVFNADISKKHRLKRVAELIVISVVFNWIVGVYVLHGFTIPHGLLSRFMFILIMMLLITAMECLQGIETVKYKFVAVSFVLFAGIYATGLLMSDEIGSVIGLLATVLLGVYYFVCLIFLKRKSIKKISLYVNIFIFGILELFVNAIISSEEAVAYSHLKIAKYDEWKAIYENFDADKGDRKTAYVGNDSTAYCSDASVFSSVINSGVLKLYNNLGLVSQKSGVDYTYRDTTPISASLFNVSQVLTDKPALFGGYQIVENNGGYYTMKPEKNINFGEVVPEKVLDWNCDMVGYSYGGEIYTPMDVQNDLTENVFGVGNVFDEYIPDNIQISTERCMVLGRNKRLSDISMPRYLKKSDGIWYRNMNIDSDLYPIINMQFKVNEDADIYAYISDDVNYIRYGLEIDGQNVCMDLLKTNSDLVHIGNLKKGQIVRLSVANTSEALTDGVTTIKLYYLNQDVVDKYYDQINQSVFKVDSFEDTEITGSVDAKEDGVLYTSIPYYRGFKVYVDGKKSEIVKVGNAMIGVNVKAGEHTVHITYRTYGLLTGSLLSMIGICVVVTYFVLNKKKRNREKNKEN